MDPLFQHPVFDSVRKKVKHAMRQLEKPPERLENSLYTCFKCESKDIFYRKNRSALLMRERPYSKNVANVTINGETDYAENVSQILNDGYINHLHNIGRPRLFKR